MKKLLALLLLFGISGCSSKIENLTVICETDGFFDKSLTFNFETNLVTEKNILNKYGYKSKKRMASITPEVMGEQQFQDAMDSFKESESIHIIRSFDEGLIIFTLPEDANITADVKSTFNRATLKMKTVSTYDEELVSAFKDMESEDVSYAECMKPIV